MHKRVFLLSSLSLASLAALPAAAQDAGPVYMLDFVFLNDGQTLGDRDAYNNRSRPIAARYGISLIATLDPLTITMGPRTLARVDVWELPSVQAIGAWGDDADYVALRPEVLRVHDLDDLTLYVASPVMAPAVVPGQVYHLELLTFSEDEWSREAFFSYIRAVDEIAATHGIRRNTSLANLNKLTGSGPTAQFFNLYAVPGANEYRAMGSDPRMTALTPERWRLFDAGRALEGAFMAQ